MSNLFHSNISQRKQFNPMSSPNSRDKHRSLLESEGAKLEKLSSKAHLMQQQIDLYTCEKKTAFDKFKEVTAQFTKTTIPNITKIKSSADDINYMAKSMVYILNPSHAGDANFQVLKNMMKKSDEFLTLIQNLDPVNINPMTLELCMAVWKNYKNFHAHFSKEAKPLILLLDLIYYATETKIKADTLLSIERKFPEFQKNVREQVDNISRITAQIQIETNRMRNTLISEDSSRKNGSRNLNTMTDSKNNKIFSAETEKNEESEIGGNNLNKAVAIIKNGALRLDDSKLNENSDVFDLPITPHEHGFSFRECFKPKPRNQIEEDKKIKNSKIILNNLLENQENLLGGSQGNNNRIVTTNHYFNDFMNQETFELLSEGNDDPKPKFGGQFKKVQEIPDSANITQVDVTDTIACCGRTIKTKFFCK